MRVWFKSGCWLLASPNGRNAVGGDPGSTTDQGDVLRFGLCDEQAVEGIALGAAATELDVGEATVGGGVDGGDRQEGEPLGQQLLSPLVGNLELAERCFDRDLEERARAEERLPRPRYRLARRGRETIVVSQPPERRVGVDEEPQSTTPRSRATSSGQTSKSSAIEIRPARAPGLRRTDSRSGMGTRRATGCLPRRSSTGSPFSARATSFERLVFASPMLNVLVT